MSPRLTPCKRDDFIRKLRKLGFHGPYPAKRHAFMVYGAYPLHIPSYDEYSAAKTREMIREVEEIIGRRISREEWNRL